MASGPSPLWICAASAAPTAVPGRFWPMSPTVYTLVAPYLPRSGANASVSPPHVKASTVLPRLRAAVSSSSEMVRGLPSNASATTQILFTGMASDHLQLLEEGHDPFVGVAFVLDDLARLALFGGGDFHDLLAGAISADLARLDTEVGDLELVDRLVLGRHDPFERRVARLDHTSRHRHQRRQRRRDLVIA